MTTENQTKIDLKKASVYLEIQDNGITLIRIHNCTDELFDVFNAIFPASKISDDLRTIHLLAEVALFKNSNRE